MAQFYLKAAFSNQTKVDGVRDDESFLYLDTTNNGFFRLQPEATATLTPSTLLPWQDEPGFNPTGTILYFVDLVRVLEDDQIKGMKFGDDWTATCFTDPERGPYWAVTPKQTVVINGGAYLDILVSQIVVTTGRQQSAATVALLYYNIPGLTGQGMLNNDQFDFAITLRDPPGPSIRPPLTDDVLVIFGGGREMYYQGVENVEFVRLGQPNAFFLAIGSKYGHPELVAGPRTSLRISFVTCNDKLGRDPPCGALASRDDISRIRLSRTSNGEGWEVRPHMEAEQPFWEVIIPSGARMNASLRFENVISQLGWGFSELIVQYQQMPGYRDGEFRCPLYKYGSPVLNRFAVNFVNFASRVDYPPGSGWDPHCFLTWQANSIEPIDIKIAAGQNPPLIDIGWMYSETGAIEVPLDPKIFTKWSDYFGAQFNGYMPFEYPPAAPSRINAASTSVIFSLRFYNDTPVPIFRTALSLRQGFWLPGHEPPAMIAPGAMVFAVATPWMTPEWAPEPYDVTGNVTYLPEGVDPALFQWEISFHGLWHHDNAWMIGQVLESSCSAPHDYDNNQPLFITTTDTMAPFEAARPSLAWSCSLHAKRQIEA